MTRALIWKEWRQLRLLRWGLTVLLVPVTPFLLAGAEASHRGWLPFGRVRSYDATNIVMDVVPLVLVAVWGIGCAMMIAQALTGDRAAGTETFLLHRPVSRSRVWSARLATTVGSIVTVMAGSLLAWLLFATTTASTQAADWSRAFEVLGIAGPLVVAAILLAGLTAGALLPSPTQAALAALLLALVPIGLALGLATLFPYSTIGHLPIGGVLPFLLFPAFVLVSYRVLCSGEPAGAGRYRRAGTIFGGSLVVVIALFLIAAPLAIRTVASQAKRQGFVRPSPTAAMAFVRGGGYRMNAGWVVDTATNEWEHFFGTPVGDAAWTPDGRFLAVSVLGGPLGASFVGDRIEIYDAVERRVIRTVTAADVGADEIHPYGEIRWAGDALLLTGLRNSMTPELIAFHRERGDVRWIAIPESAEPFRWRVIARAEDGAVFVAAALRDSMNRATARSEKEYALFRMDLDAGTTDLVLTETGSVYGARGGLSPSGRYWISGPTDRTVLELLDLHTGERLRLAGSVHLRRTWLVGDRLVWTRDDEDAPTVWMWSPGQDPARIDPGDLSGWLWLDVSPDLRRLLVVSMDADSREDDLSETDRATAPRTQSLWILDDESGAWTPLESPPHTSVLTFGRMWAGPDTLAWATPDGLVFLPAR